MTVETLCCVHRKNLRDSQLILKYLKILRKWKTKWIALRKWNVKFIHVYR